MIELGNNFFTIAALFFNILLFWVYFSKERIRSFETKTYDKIVTFSLIINIIAIICYYTIINKDSLRIINDIFSKALLVCYIIWILFFTIYMIGTSNKNIPKILGKKLVGIVNILVIAFGIIIAYLPLYYHNLNNQAYSYGPAANLVFVFCGMMVVIWLILIAKNMKRLRTKQFYPLFVIIFLGALVVYLQHLKPELLLLTFLIAFITFIMYFTIENPDAKMLDELAKNKKIIENQNEDTTNFLFRITQDIKKPILDLLEESKGRDMIDARYINNKMRELDFTVNDVLDVSGMSTRRIKLYDNNYDIHNLMKEIKIKTESELPKEIKLEYNISRNVPKMLYGDYIMLKKVVLSMIDNAIKHTKEGYISLDVDAIVKYDVARVIISVSDTGIGMGLDMINDILSHEISDEEYRLDNEKGILNLKDIKHIMPSLDGTFVIKSERDLGTTVSITVNEKIVNTEEREIAKKIEMYEESLNSGKKIMVVDDDAIELSKIKKIIEHKGNSCNTSLFGKDIVEKVSKGHKFDLIILDDETDTHSAYEIFSQLKKIKGFDIPVVIMIDDDKEFVKLHFLKDGFSDVILKSKLNDEINRVLDKRK